MRPRTEIPAAVIVSVLEETGGNVEAAARILTREVGRNVSSRTLRRRMADHGIKPRVRYEMEDAA